MYAHYQHDRLDLRDPAAGWPRFLSRPLREHHRGCYAQIACALFRPRGLVQAMADAMEDLSAKVAEHAPVESGDLRRSGHPTVTDDGAVVYDRAPAQHRHAR